MYFACQGRVLAVLTRHIILSLEVDVLIIAVEASLWIGEQFASDLQTLFPALRVVAMSANKVIGKSLREEAGEEGIPSKI